MKKKKCIRKVRSGGIIYTDEEGRLYRPDGPAIIFKNGREVWSTRATPRNTKYYLTGTKTHIPIEPHRRNGPAVIEPSGNTMNMEYGISLSVGVLVGGYKKNSYYGY